jgi:gluconate 2-dehydrogenase subunit 3-like protein
MENQSALQITSESKSRTRPLNRREWIARMLGGMTAGIAFPGLAAAHPVREHLAHASTLDLAEAQVASANWTPEFLDSFQAQTLAALAERIIPGSSRAQSDRFIDTLLSVDKRENQERFVDSLSAFEGEAMKKFRHSFKDLTETEQDEILTTASTMDSGHPHAAGGRRRRRVSLGPPPASGSQEQDTIRDHFENLKGWVVGAYYSSEVGMRELGWNGEVMFESYPGCEHPGGHV